MQTRKLRSLLRVLLASVSGMGCADDVCTRTEETYESALPEDWNHLSCEEACVKLFPQKTTSSCTGNDHHVTCWVEDTSCRPYTIMHGRPARDFVPSVARSSELGAWFLHLAEIEAASVPSFLDLARDLARHELPDRYVREARRSAVDERRHARLMQRLAQRAGARRRVPTVERRPPMTLFELAVANVTEGCVTELFAAAVTQWVADNAQDEEHRAVFRRVARDETRHAAFALTLGRALMDRLDDDERERVDAAWVEACVSLRRAVVVDAVLTRAGLHPPRAVQHAILDAIEHGAWS